MKYRQLGKTDLNVSVICLGTMTWGLQNTREEAFEQMDFALEQGVNFFDTAEMYAVPPSPDTYGKTETILGEYFHERKNRDRVILASKIAGPGMPWIREKGARIDRKNLELALEGSLRRLRTDWIDLYQLHWTNRPNYHFGRYWSYDPSGVDRQRELDNFVEVLETLDRFIQEGKIRHAGLSNETAWGSMNWLRLAEEKGLPRMVSIQNEYSLLCRIFEPDLAEVAMREDLGLLAWSPLAAGMISGKYRDGKRPAGSRWSITNRKHNQRDTPAAHRAVDALHEVAKKHGLDVTQMALAFVNERPFVTSSIIGATGMDQLRSNIDSIHLSLSPEVYEDLENFRREFPIVY